MNPFVVGGLAYLGWRWLFAKPTPAKSSGQEVSKEANDALGIILAPSMTDVQTLLSYYGGFMKAAETADTNGALRYAQYALVAFLKACMLAKGAVADSDELLAIARAPISGGFGLVSYGDASIDQQTAIATALTQQHTDQNAIGQYMAAFAQQFAANKKPRMMAYLLACQAKQMCLRNAVNWPGAVSMPASTFFAIANIPAANVPDVKAISATSILVYK